MAAALGRGPEGRKGPLSPKLTQFFDTLEHVMEDFKTRCVKCPTCGDVFTIERGLRYHGDETLDRRVAERVEPYSMRILLEENLREFPVVDLSEQGIGIKHKGWHFDLGQTLIFDIIQDYRIRMKNVKAQVVRSDEAMVGCNIIDADSGTLKDICATAVLDELELER